MKGVAAQISRLRSEQIAAAWTKLYPVPAVVILAMALCILVSALDVFPIARLLSMNADTVSGFLSAQSILKGNVLLAGWHLAPDSYYFDETLPLAMIEAVFGKRIAELPVFSLVVHVLILTAAMLAAVRLRDGLRSGLVAVSVIILLLGAPPAGVKLHMIEPASHGTGIALSVVALLLLAKLARVGTARCASTVAAFAVVSCLTIASDPFPLVFAFGPAILILGYDSLAERQPWNTAALAVLVTVCVLAGMAVPHLITWVGGFHIEAGPPIRFVTPGHLAQNAEGIVFGVLQQSGANLFGKDVLSLAAAQSGLRLAAWVAGIAAVAKQPRKREVAGVGLDSFLLAGTASLIVACLASQVFDFALPDSLADDVRQAARYLTPLIVFGAVLAARAMPDAIDQLPTRRLRFAATGALLAGAAGLLAMQTVTSLSLTKSPPWIKANAYFSIGQYLLARNLTCGVGDYWDANIVTALSQSRVIVRAVSGSTRGTLAPFLWVSDERWYTGVAHPKFAIWREGADAWMGVTGQSLAATYGTPERVEHAFGYSVAIFAGSSCY